MTAKTRAILRRAAGGPVVAAAILLAGTSSGHAYWLNGVWIAPGVPPYGYYQSPPPAYYGPNAHHPVWVAPRWDGYRWVPGHWSAY
jgi:hypothetical protein